MTVSGKPRARAKAKAKAAAKAANAPAAGRADILARYRDNLIEQSVGYVDRFEPRQVVTLRLTPSLKAELEAEARAFGRTLSDVMRDRLSQNHTSTQRLTETVRLLTSAIKARVGHEEIERLIEIHMESFKR